MAFPPRKSAFWLAILLRKSVSPFGGGLCFGWLGSLKLCLYKPLGCVSTLWKWIPTGKDTTIHYQKVLKISENIPYLSVEFDVGADFTWMSIMFPNGILISKSFKTIHFDPQSRKLIISKIEEVQEIYSSESRCFLESTGIYCIPLLCFLRDRGFDCAVINPIITKNSINMSVRKLYDDKFDLKKVVEVGLGVSLKASIVPDDVIIGLYNLVRDHYHFKDLQSVIVLRLHAELKISFPAYLNVFSKVTMQASLKLLETYPLVADMLTALKDELMETIRSTVCFEETCALTRYDAMCIAAKGAATFGCALLSNALRTGLYTKMHGEYQAHLDDILEELHQVVGKLEKTPDYDRISFIQILHGVGSLSAVVLIAEMGIFNLFSSPKKLYAYFGLDPGVNDSGKFYGDRVHMSKRGFSLARRILHMVAINNLKMDKATETPVSPAIYDYHARKYASKRENAVVRVVIHKIYNIVFAMLRDSKPFELAMPGGHHERYVAKHPESVNLVA